MLYKGLQRLKVKENIVKMSNDQGIALLKEAVGEHLALLLLLVNSKVTAQSGKGLSTNDFTTALLDKLNGIQAGAQVNVATNLGRSSTATAVSITSSTGNSASIPAATTTAAGVMSSADKTKLNNVGTMANRDVHFRTTEPANSVGANGDIVFVYE